MFRGMNTVNSIVFVKKLQMLQILKIFSHVGEAVSLNKPEERGHPSLSYLGRGGAWCPAVSMQIYVLGGALGWRVLDDFDVGNWKDALLGRSGNLPLIPVLIDLPDDYDSLTLQKTNTCNT